MRAPLVAVAVILSALIAPAGPSAHADESAVERGGVVFLKCKSCHRIGPGASNAAGPHLNGVFGRRAGALDGFRFSKDIKRMGAEGLVWDHTTLDLYLENPKSLVSRTRMNFRGLRDPGDRADLIAFLRAYSDDPQNIPESAPTEAPRTFTGDPPVEAAILAIQGDPDYGAYLSGECVTCHRADGADEGIPSITGWPVADFVTALHAYRAAHRANPAMQMVASRLSDEEIAGLAAYFGDLE